MPKHADSNGDVPVTKAPSSDRAPSSGPRRLADEAFEMPFSPGDIIGGKYQVTELLGVGGVGFVVAAIHMELGEKVALKFLQPDMLDNTQVVGRFSQEALASVKIKSEHVARVFDVGTLPDGAPFIVIEHLEGKDLDDILRQYGPMPIKRAVDYVMQACEALANAHACGVVHRDIKPENLFLTRRAQGMDVIKVLDFGISKVALTGTAIEPRVPLVKTMLPVGSPLYMSPEQVRASQDIDSRTDIWSVGCVLYELLGGHAAFDAPSITEVSARILEQEPTPLRSLRPDVPSELEAIIQRCLEKDPDQRYQNVAELALALYPFGPRRARISAERCCLLLNVGETSFSEFELPSISLVAPSFVTPLPLPDESGSAHSWPTLNLKHRPPSKRTSTRKALILGAVVVLAIASVEVWGRLRASGAMGASSARRQPVPPSAFQSPTPIPVKVGSAPGVPTSAVAAVAVKVTPAPLAPSSVQTTVEPKPPVRAVAPTGRSRAYSPAIRSRQTDSGRSANTSSPEPDPGF
jgi:serine/threonine protein kinase